MDNFPPEVFEEGSCDDPEVLYKDFKDFNDPEVLHKVQKLHDCAIEAHDRKHEFSWEGEEAKPYLHFLVEHKTAQFRPVVIGELDRCVMRGGWEEWKRKARDPASAFVFEALEGIGTTAAQQVRQILIAVKGVVSDAAYSEESAGPELLKQANAYKEVRHQFLTDAVRVLDLRRVDEWPDGLD